MTRIDIIVVSQIIIGEKLPQVIMTAFPDLTNNELLYLFRQLADSIEQEMHNVIALD